MIAMIVVIAVIAMTVTTITVAIVAMTDLIVMISMVAVGWNKWNQTRSTSILVSMRQISKSFALPRRRCAPSMNSTNLESKVGGKTHHYNRWGHAWR